MQTRIDRPLTEDETARLVAAVAYATKRAALERKARAAVRRRDFVAAGKLAQQARELDRAAFGK